jgi:hypothetical protein
MQDFSHLPKPEDFKPKESSNELDQKTNEDLGVALNKGSQVLITLESGGRFGSPETLSLHDYTNQQINDIILSRQDDMFETLVSVINDLCTTPNFKAEELTISELMEVLMSLKIQFNKEGCEKHPVRWSCSCQKDSLDPVLSEAFIDLSTVQLQNITALDEALRENQRGYIMGMPDSEFEAVCIAKYGKVLSRDDFIGRIRIEEPFKIRDEDGTEYGFSFIKIKHLLSSYKMAKQKYMPKIQAVKRRTKANVSGAQLEYEKREDIEKLNIEMGRYAVLLSQANSLVSNNGKEITDIHEKVKIFQSIPRRVIARVDDFLSFVNYGIVDKRDLTCNLCGKSDGRWLQQVSNPLDFIPLSGTDESSNKLRSPDEFRNAKSISVYF